MTVDFEGEIVPARWLFRADMVIDGKQISVDWAQKDQAEEPPPDPRAFFPAISALLANAEAR
jgi:hypothetical protein